MNCVRTILITQAIFLVLLLNASLQAQDVDTLNNTRSFFEKGNITGTLSYQFGRISDYGKNQDGSLNYLKPEFKFRSSLSVSIGIRLFELVYFRPSFYAHLNPDINAPWATTDYTYTLERTCYDNNSFSYGYANYEINKYNGSGNSFLESLKRGSFYVRYFNAIPQRWMQKIGADSVTVNYFLTTRYMVRYTDDQNETKGDWLHGKTVLSAGVRCTLFRFFYVEGAVNYYVSHKTKMSWDPDFTYGFGFNKYTHMTIGLSYGNYSGNRFPWNEKKIKEYGFLDGIFSVLLNFRF